MINKFLILSITVCSIVFISLSSCSNNPAYESDYLPPDIAIVSPTNGQWVGSNFTITGIVSDDVSGVEAVYMKTDNGEYIAANISGQIWGAFVPLQYYGVHTNYVYAIDKAGNTSIILSVRIVCNNVPSVSIVSPLSGAVTNVSNLTIFGCAAVSPPFEITLVQIKVNGGDWSDAVGSTKWSNAVVLTTMSNTVSARVFSDNGKTNVSPEWLIVVD